MADSVSQNAAAEHLNNAKSGLERVKSLLAQPSVENAEHAAQILGDVEIQLGCASAVLEENSVRSGPEFRCSLEELQCEVAGLARFLSGSEKLLSDWLKALQTKRGGYTLRGQAAPLVLVSKVAVEG